MEAYSLIASLENGTPSVLTGEAGKEPNVHKKKATTKITAKIDFLGAEN